MFLSPPFWLLYNYNSNEIFHFASSKLIISNPVPHPSITHLAGDFHPSNSQPLQNDVNGEATQGVWQLTYYVSTWQQKFITAIELKWNTHTLLAVANSSLNRNSSIYILHNEIMMSSVWQHLMKPMQWSRIWVFTSCNLRNKELMIKQRNITTATDRTKTFPF